MNSRAVLRMLGIVGLAWIATTCGNGEAPPTSESEGSPAVQAAPGNLPDDPPSAQRQTLLDLRASMRTPKHASDGGGRAWLEPESTTPIRAGERGHWTIAYETGPQGIAEGGFVRLTVPFVWWNWSAPQLETPEAPGYTTAECSATGVKLEGRSGLQGLEFLVRGRALAAGEIVRITYGAGALGAQSDSYAERESHFWIAVDGDGDGHARILTDSPAIDVLPGPPELLVAVLPSTAEPGEALTLRLSFLDRSGSRGAEFVGKVTLIAHPEGLELPGEVEFTPADHGCKRVAVRAGEKGVYRLLAHAADDGGEFVVQANPLLVEPGVAPVRWGDLHGHSNLSDGTGTPEDFLAYARDVAGLDAVCLTDHDHFGMLGLDEYPEPWARIRAAAEAAYEPGKFVSVLGYEWTNWVHGHRHVLYFGSEGGEVLSSVDERYETPAQLWAALRGTQALTFAHHSAGGPIATNWNFAPDPELEPVTEVASVHGASEAPDAPRSIYNPLAGNSIRDALDRGYLLGFIGSGDSHDGHPGLCHLVNPQKGGLAALLTRDLTREGLRSALKERRAYATNGPRILLRCALDGQRMGSRVAPKSGPALLYVRAIACAPIRSLELVRNGKVTETFEGSDYWDVEASFQPIDLVAGEYLYVRVIQDDDGAAWSSPFFIR